MTDDGDVYKMNRDVSAAVSGFDELAEDYDRTRPVCPPVLFDDLVALAALSAGDRVLEIGCGTGQATFPLAARGLAVTAIELGANLAAIARRRLSRFAAVAVVTSSFEGWQPASEPHGATVRARDFEFDARPFAAVAAFNSLHWIDPELRYAKPAALLAPGGAMVVGGCHWALPENAEPFWREVQADYQAVGYEGSPPPPPEAIEPWHFPVEAAPFFAETAARRYPFQVVYSAEEYQAILATQSGTRLLGEERRAEFLTRVRARLALWPRLTATFVGYLTVGRRIAGA